MSGIGRGLGLSEARSLRQDSPGAIGGRPVRRFVLPGVVLLMSACTSLSSLESSPVTDEEPVTETAGSRDEEADVVDPDELTFAVENSDEVFDPETVPEVPMPDLASPEQLPELDSQVIEAIAEAVDSPDVAILDVADVVDDGPTPAEIASFRDGNTRSHTGELIVLDQRASLACANIEIALSHLDGGDKAAAAEQVTTAAERSRLSNLSEIREWSPALVESIGQDEDGTYAVDATVLVGFLSVCVDGGHAL